MYKRRWGFGRVLTSLAHHGGDELGDDGSPLPHLALLTVGEVWEHARDAACTRGPARVHCDQHLHDGGVHVSEKGKTAHTVSDVSGIVVS